MNLSSFITTKERIIGMGHKDHRHGTQGR